MNKLNLDIRDLNKLKRILYQHDIGLLMLPNYLNEEGHPCYQILNNLVEEAYENLQVLNKDELQIVEDQFGWFHKKMLENPPFKNKLYTTALYSIIYELKKVSAPYDELISNDYAQSEVIKVYPELIKYFDEDMLLEIVDKFHLTSFGIGYKDHILYYSKFLRKHYSGQFIPEFINALLKSFKKENSYRIAIDHTRLILKEDLQTLLELDHWYGPHFDVNDLDNPEKIGLTVIGRTKPPLMDSKKTLIRTEFLWEMKRENIKQVLIEEVSHSDNNFGKYYINRAIHSERNIQIKKFTHFDGAVYIYNKDEYDSRIAGTIKDRIKPFVKKKLFRIDGEILNEDWINYVSLFFRGNEMIIEYFDEEGFEKRFKNRPDSYLEWLNKNNAV